LRRRPHHCDEHGAISANILRRFKCPRNHQARRLRAGESQSHCRSSLFSQWLLPAARPLVLIGSSIAAWRFACGAQKDPGSALNKFQEAYVQQTYSASPSAAEVKPGASRRVVYSVSVSDAQFTENKVCHDGDELFRGLKMDPVSGIRNHGELVIWKMPGN